MIVPVLHFYDRKRSVSSANSNTLADTIIKVNNGYKKENKTER